MEDEVKTPKAEAQAPDEVKPDKGTEPEAEAQAEAKPDPEAAKLEKLAASFIEAEVPEDKRALVPSSLSPAEQMEWVITAKKLGVFAKTAPANGPDTKRPSTKRVKDTSGMSPMQKIMAGLS